MHFPVRNSQGAHIFRLIFGRAESDCVQGFVLFRKSVSFGSSSSSSARSRAGRRMARWRDGEQTFGLLFRCFAPPVAQGHLGIVRLCKQRASALRSKALLKKRTTPLENPSRWLHSQRSGSFLSKFIDVLIVGRCVSDSHSFENYFMFCFRSRHKRTHTRRHTANDLHSDSIAPVAH